jgi:uncharacterized protein (DUF1330 family)
MKSHWRVTAAGGIGIGLGLLGGFSLAAPTRSAYVVTELDQITDARAYESLKAMSAQALVGAQMSDGRYLVRSEDIVALDGTPPKAMVIVAFDSEAKAKAYYANTKELAAARMKAGSSRSFIVRVCSERGVISADC